MNVSVALLAGALTFASAPADPEVTLDLFKQIIASNDRTLKTVAFIYEGEVRWIGPPWLIENRDGLEEDFQGAYLYRNDGAAMCDMYVSKRSHSSRVMRSRTLVFHDRVEKVQGLVDSRRGFDSDRDVRRQKGSLASISGASSPHDVFMFWFWKVVGPLQDLGFEFQGWEMVDGRKCLRFQLDSWNGGQRKGLDFQRYWMDVERGAQVVAFETYVEKQLVSKMDQVTLMVFEGPDKVAVWFPTRGRKRLFRWKDRFYTDPVVEIKYSVVRRSITVNGSLPDSLFSIRRSSALPLPSELTHALKSTGPDSLSNRFERQASSDDESVRLNPGNCYK
jgi:hypothetical protein